MSTNLSRNNCPVRADAQHTAKLSGQMLKSFRRLVRKIRNCPTCPDYQDCPVLAEFNATVDQVILELNDEWDLK
jgi:hypothetical protein